MATALSKKEINTKLAALDGWERSDDDGSICNAFIFDDFDGAMDFINQVAAIARELDHHPELYNVYNEVSLSLITHDANGLTDKDFVFANRVTELLDQDDDDQDEDDQDDD